MYVMASVLPIVGLLLSVQGASQASGPPEEVFLEKTLQLSGETFTYRVFVPKDWNSLQNWPVIVFLHGLGERGEDGYKQTTVGLGPAIRKNPSTLPAVLVLPQCRRGLRWDDDVMEKLVMETLRRSIAEYNGDMNRVYLTGLSMGGYGTLYFGAKYPNKFAALAPVCGGIVPPRRARRTASAGSEDPYEAAAKRIAQTPVWLFHGASDPVVPVSESRRMVEALRAQGNTPRYTEYPGVGHNSWDRAYSEPDLFTWMLAQRR